MTKNILVAGIFEDNIKVISLSYVEDEIKLTRVETIDNRGDIDSRDIIAEYIEKNGYEDSEIIIVIGSKYVNYRDFHFPFDSNSKVLKAIEFDISSEFPLENNIFDYIKGISSVPGKYRFWSAIVEKSILRSILERLQERNIRVLRVTTDVSSLGRLFRDQDDVFVMEINNKDSLFVYYIHGVPVLIRHVNIGIEGAINEDGKIDYQKANPLIREIRRTTHSFGVRTETKITEGFLTGDIHLKKEIIKWMRSVTDLNIIEELPDIQLVIEGSENEKRGLYASLIGAGLLEKRADVFNFLKGEFLKTDSFVTGKRYAIIGTGAIFLLLFVIIFSVWLNIVSLEKRKHFIETTIRRTFVSNFPHIKNVVDELRQAKNILDMKRKELMGANPLSMDSPLQVIDKISRSIPSDCFFQINSFLFENQRVEIIGQTDSFKNVNRIRSFLSGVDDFSKVDISNAKSVKDGKSIQFKITIQIKGEI